LKFQLGMNGNENVIQVNLPQRPELSFRISVLVKLCSYAAFDPENKIQLQIV